ncbi:hypothetical protein ST47_g7745 [Ascochyta rabiei]|uniref:Uncharacterized protein n=1 Tax=Didymella rabiei TaxID=5454 RepID=A0A163ACD5_DIDRA|nr:hypothetical protein ST47_g7745 [Ascochyta rabiei]
MLDETLEAFNKLVKAIEARLPQGSSLNDDNDNDDDDDEDDDDDKGDDNDDHYIKYGLVDVEVLQLHNIPTDSHILLIKTEHDLSPDTKLQTIRVSLNAGEQPTDFPCFGFEDFIESSQGRDPVSLAIINDDKDSLKLLFANLRDVLDGTQVLGKMWFYSGQDDLPTPLSIVARMARPEYALALLENGASV